MPNVSLCVQENEVHYNPIETRVVATYNVTSTSNPTPIGFNQFISAFTEIEIDGVVQPTVVSAYTFDTVGEHTVKYTLTDTSSIGTSSFYQCKGLTSVIIPNSVIRIGNYAFSNCMGLPSVTIPNSVTNIGQYAFQSCRVLTNIIIPDSVTSIGDGAFQSCRSLTSVTIGNGVTSIGSNAFEICSGLTEITIPNNVTTIGGDAFSNCSGLTSVTIGSGVTSISNYAFNSCSSLISITSLATTAPTIYSSTFYNVKTNGTLTVPSGSSGYEIWMGTGNYYLGKYNWTKVEQ